jgi:hypothetical protein
MTTVEAYERDVLDCGVPLGEARALRKRYERALNSGICADWIELYVGTFATLLRCTHRTRHADLSASRRLLQLVCDDLGVQLFDDDARLQLELALMHTAA